RIACGRETLVHERPLARRALELAQVVCRRHDFDALELRRLVLADDVDDNALEWCPERLEIDALPEQPGLPENLHVELIARKQIVGDHARSLVLDNPDTFFAWIVPVNENVEAR